ncbi:transposase subfamily protein [gamma proteobacterium NOR5-3]|nr:transposase subfamily protein [gamma proteobacterium NOR5-3]
MKRQRYTEEQIISILKQEADRTMVDLAREYGIAGSTLYRWKSMYGGMEVSDAKRRRNSSTERLLLSAGR